MSLYESVLELMRRRRQQPSMTEAQARDSVRPRKSPALIGIAPVTFDDRERENDAVIQRSDR